MGQSSLPRPTRRHPNDEVIILYWTEYYGKAGAGRPENSVPYSFRCSLDPVPGEFPMYVDDAPGIRQVNVRLETDRRLIRSADVVLFHASDVYFDDLPPKFEGQKWVLVNMESPVHLRCARSRVGCVQNFIRDSRLTKIFDWSSGYRLDSTFPSPYIVSDGSFIKNLECPVGREKLSQRKGEPSIVWLAADCAAENGREAYVKELMTHVGVHSYGSCLNNIKLPNGFEKGGKKPVGDLLKDYKFYLAFENSNCYDYVTEKFSRAIELGLVPVVFGGANYSRFAPPHSYIDVRDFREDPNDPHSRLSPANLAKHLKELDSDDAKYLSYFAHQEAPIASDFRSFWTRSKESEFNYCQMARKVHRIPDVLVSAQGESVEPDLSCEETRWNEPTQVQRTPPFSSLLPGGRDRRMHGQVVLVLAIIICTVLVVVAAKRWRAQRRPGSQERALPVP